ncbi:DedA family protein [Brevundimonas sp. S30B]|uniref:DedA family protein n=1 Tax=unclassified Brevundimonas TaxID=2622653 RepID=UPI001071A2B5|nr:MULTISPECIES: DedA family protein [unclassified Brevundimonas]QBX37638.1 DedA family protein [Brevundimonas sp. MF30-B]TFW03569.1 DedA family protein [Brevundimonas sp. S30B]
MEDLLRSVADFISRNQVWAGLILGSITFLESLAVIGAFVPATGLLVAAGAMVAMGVLDPWNVLLGCVIGAVLGDALSFWLGRRLGPSVLRHQVFKPHRRRVAWTRLFAYRYGVASVYIGRFFGPLRAFVPVTVGILGMRQKTFQIANVLSAFVWVGAMLAPGYLAQKGLARLEAMSEAHGPTLAAIAAVAVFACGYIAYRWIKGRTLKRAERRVLARFPEKA